MNAQSLTMDIEKLADERFERDEFLLKSAILIQTHYPYYNWVGFYFLKEGKLYVGPYVGKPTPHTIIELNSGICGAAVSQRKTIVIDDVKADPRYLVCSLETKSEIVIPIEINGKIIGELDIDSEKLAAFSDDDRQILESATKVISSYLGKL